MVRKLKKEPGPGVGAAPATKLIIDPLKIQAIIHATTASHKKPNADSEAFLLLGSLVKPPLIKWITVITKAARPKKTERDPRIESTDLVTLLTISCQAEAESPANGFIRLENKLKFILVFYSFHFFD